MLWGTWNKTCTSTFHYWWTAKCSCEELWLVQHVQLNASGVLQLSHSQCAQFALRCPYHVSLFDATVVIISRHAPRWLMYMYTTGEICLQVA